MGAQHGCIWAWLGPAGGALRQSGVLTQMPNGSDSKHYRKWVFPQSVFGKGGGHFGHLTLPSEVVHSLSSAPLRSQPRSPHRAPAFQQPPQSKLPGDWPVCTPSKGNKTWFVSQAGTHLGRPLPPRGAGSGGEKADHTLLPSSRSPPRRLPGKEP